jgi:MFS family permease
MLRSQIATDQERLERILDPDAITPAEDRYSTMIELARVQGQTGEIASPDATRNPDPTHQEPTRPLPPISQGIPAELPNLLAEIIFILTCTGGQLVSALLLGHVAVTQASFGAALAIPPSQLPWLLGSSSLAAGLSVTISGSLADLTPPKPLMVGGFLWSALWNAVAAVAVRPRLKVLFFVARAMQGLAAGVLVVASMSILGRVYTPGRRKTRVFSAMAAGSPFGYWLGCLQAGALSSHLGWIFGSTAILMTGFAVTAYLTIPSLRPASDTGTAEAPSLRQFDYVGAGLAAAGCGLLVFGLTQGSSAHWNPYTYISIILGFAMLVGFYFVEKRVARPLVPNKLWQTPGFTSLLIAYFLGLGAYSKFSKSHPSSLKSSLLTLSIITTGGGWQFYAIQFWQRYQHATPLTTALYLLPNGLVGILAAYLVSRTMHLVPTHIILTISMLSFALGPAFFLPQTPSTSYYALSMPGIALATFGPDMSFAAAAIFVTSSVPRSYQGTAGSLLVTVQNLTVAIMTSVGEGIGTKVDGLPTGEIGFRGIRAIWWFGLAAALMGALITATTVRIEKAEEKEHVH